MIDKHSVDNIQTTSFEWCLKGQSHIQITYLPKICYIAKHTSTNDENSHFGRTNSHVMELYIVLYHLDPSDNDRYMTEHTIHIIQVRM